MASLEKSDFYPKWLSSQKAIIEPATFSKRLRVKDAIICFSEDFYFRLLKSFDLHDSKKAPFYLRILKSFGLHDSKKAPQFPGAVEGKLNDTIALYLASFGAPPAGMLFETLIASGIVRLLMVGEAGSISPNCKMGDIFIPTWGIREEGTSYHYLPPTILAKPSEDYLETVKKCLGSIEFLEGGVWSIDAPYRETVDKVKEYVQRGVFAVEMECTTLMSIAMYRNVDFAAVLVITDELFGKKWVGGFGSKRVKKSKDLISERVHGVFCNVEI